MSFRTSGKLALSRVMKIEKNIEIIEKLIYEKCVNNENKYKNMVYEVVEYIKNGSKILDAMKELKEGRLLYNHPAFNEVKFKQQEQDEFIMNPFQVEEGVLKCPKCGQCRTFSYSKQTRSADEPMTTFATCMNCKHKWTYSG